MALGQLVSYLVKKMILSIYTKMIKELSWKKVLNMLNKDLFVKKKIFKIC